jgi:hypothetical protein
MFESLRREQATRVAEWEMTMMLTGAFMGVKSEAYMPIITPMKQHLAKRLNGRAYSATFVREALISKRDELNRERNLLNRLDKLGKEGS